MRDLPVNQRIGSVWCDTVVVTRDLTRRDIDRRRAEKICRAVLRGEQGPDFLFKRLVTGACAPQGVVPLARRSIQHRLQDSLNLFPAFRVHPWSIGQFATQPRLCRSPIAFHRHCSYAEYLRALNAFAIG